MRTVLPLLLSLRGFFTLAHVVDIHALLVFIHIHTSSQKNARKLLVTGIFPEERTHRLRVFQNKVFRGMS
jgi:hypothetical protein